MTAQLVSKDGSLPRRLQGVRRRRHRARAATAPGSRPRSSTWSASTRSPAARSAASSTPRPRSTGLRPDSVHHYRFALSDGATTGDAYFTTAPRALGPRRPRWRRAVHLHRLRRRRHEQRADRPEVRLGPGPGRRHRRRRHLAAWDLRRQLLLRHRPDRGHERHRPPAGGHADVNLMAAQRPVFTLLAGDICYADPGGSGLPADDSGAISGNERRPARTSTTPTSGTSS